MSRDGPNLDTFNVRAEPPIFPDYPAEVEQQVGEGNPYVFGRSLTPVDWRWCFFMKGSPGDVHYGAVREPVVNGIGPALA